MSFTQFISLVLTKVHLNLKSEAAKSYLSYTWWILEPALFVGVFYLVFGVFMATRTDNFVVFLVCGKIPFLWFARTVNNSANAILAGRGLMNQIDIPKVFFPSVVILQDAVKSSVVFAIMLIFIWVMGITPAESWISIPIIMFVQLLFIAAVALIGAAVVPFIPDLKYIIATLVMMVMFASGIFYDYRKVILESHQDLFLLNPMANLIRSYREVLLGGQWPDWRSLIIIACISSLVIVFMLSIYRQVGSRYPRLVLQ